MALEPITFRCDGCNKNSRGELDFRYTQDVRHRGQWMIVVEYERTNGHAKCENCGKINEVWPTLSENVQWIKKQSW